MKKPGFPPSTIALVVLMFGALFMVSRTVTPPPAAPPPVLPASATTETAAPQGDPGHGEPGHVHGKGEGEKPNATAATPDPKKQKEQQEQMRKMYEQKIKEENAQKEIDAKAQAEVQKRMGQTKADGKKLPKYDPTNNNIDNKFFTEIPMGDTGIKVTDEAVAQAEAIKTKMRQTEALKKPAPSKSEQMKQAAP